MAKVIKTNIGDKGGLLVGKPHNDKNGNPIGGIKAKVVETNEIIEVEGNEAVINAEASKKNWRELSKINQSVGGGVPIVPPSDTSSVKPNSNGKKNEKDVVITDDKGLVELKGGSVIINKKATEKYYKELSEINQSAGDGVEIQNPKDLEGDVDEYKKGGTTIQFNPNKVPSRWVYGYAKKIKNNYPDIWDLGGNIYGNEAFVNLERVIKRGYWLESEEWFYIKWQSFNARHKGDFLIAGVIANLKWLNKVEKGWDYMKDLIEAEIEKRYEKKMETGGEVDREYETEQLRLSVKSKKLKRLQDEIKKAQFSGNIKKIEQILKEIQEAEKMALGGELKKGIKAEQEHNETYKKIYNHEIPLKDAPKLVAEDHLEEDEHYYTKLAKMEGMKSGGKVAEVMREFKEGTLKTSYGEKVTDEKQAIAIALSEQKSYEAKKALGGKVNCENCGHSWHKVDNHSTDVEVCHLCGHDNRLDLNNRQVKPSIEINKVEIMEKSDIFYNTDIFVEAGDFTLGGFNSDDLNGIETVGDKSFLNFRKLKVIFEKRLEDAIDNYKNEIKSNIMLRGDNTDTYEVNTQIEYEIKNIMGEYLSIDPTTYDTESLCQMITNNSAYMVWLSRIENRLQENKQTYNRNEGDINKEENNRISVKYAEECTYDLSFLKILEQLGNIIEANTI